MKSRKPKKEGKLILPPPTANGRGELAPFLKAKHIPKDGITKISMLGEGRESKSKFGEGVEVACKIESEQYSWTIKRDSGNYRRLFERFGEEIENWKGFVKVERKEYMGNEYIAVVD
jgi:hypothetical protein